MAIFTFGLDHSGLRSMSCFSSVYETFLSPECWALRPVLQLHCATQAPEYIPNMSLFKQNTQKHGPLKRVRTWILTSRLYILPHNFLVICYKTTSKPISIFCLISFQKRFLFQQSLFAKRNWATSWGQAPYLLGTGPLSRDGIVSGLLVDEVGVRGRSRWLAHAAVSNGSVHTAADGHGHLDLAGLHDSARFVHGDLPVLPAENSVGENVSLAAAKRGRRLACVSAIC